MSEQVKKLLKVETVAEILDVTTWRVYELVRRGLLPAVHLGKHVRIDPDVLDNWIRNGGSRLPAGSTEGQSSPTV